MIHNYQEFILETLKSHTLEVATRRLTDFFKKSGYNEKTGWGSEAPSPNFQIVHDKTSMIDTLEEYRNPTKDFLKIIMDHFKTKDKKVAMAEANKIGDSIEEQIKNFKYGDISVFSDTNSPEILKGLLNLIETLGYFVAVGGKDYYEGSTPQDRKAKDKTKLFDELKDQKGIFLMIEPYYDNEIKFEGQYLYHSTNKDNLKKIMIKGLIPKSRNTRSFYPDRIYLSPDLKNNEFIQKQLATDKGGEYINLRIQNFPGLKLYKDIRYPSGFFTYTNIPAKYIKEIK